jgi:hypothetical protein
MKNIEIDGECGTHKGEDRCIQEKLQEERPFGRPRSRWENIKRIFNRRLATGWKIRISNPMGKGTKFFTAVQRPWGPPSLLFNG